MKKFICLLALVVLTSQTYAATSFIEDFSGGVMPANMQLGSSFDGQNHVSFGSGTAQWDAVQNRQYLRTIASDYASVDFLFDVTVTVSGGTAWGGAFIGLGDGNADAGNWGEPTNPKIAITIQPTGWFGDIYGRDNAQTMALGAEFLGAIGDGTHRVQMNWDAATQTAFFQIDAYYAGGGFVADYTTGIFTGSDNGFNSTNAHIFVGGGENMVVDNISVVLTSQTYTATSFTEDFSGGAMPANMESNFAGGASYDNQNHISFVNGTAQWDSAQNRQYLRTIASDYSSVNFCFDATMTTTGTAWGGIFVGMGDGNADLAKSGEPTDPKIVITIQPTGWSGDIYGRDNSEIMSLGLLGVIGDGTHRVRMNWDASTQTAVFQIDAYYTGGEFVADYTTGVFTGSDNGFDITNSHLFIGGGENMVVDNISVVIPAPPAMPLPQIIVGESASDIEYYAGSELQRYLYQLTSELPDVVSAPVDINMPSFVIGTQASNALLASFVSQGLITVSANDPGPQGYVIKKITYNSQPVTVILGADEVGVMYGVYGLLEDHYGIGFYFSGDVVPAPVPSLAMPEVNETKTPAMYIRGFLPWTNFFQSATVYSWEDWKYVIDQMAKMRMNFLLIHNYNAEGGHNEMFHNFTLNGITSKVWMPTAKTGHAWGCPGWEPSEYQFGAKDIFDDYDFGASCALHNENLSNLNIFAKGVNLFQRVIAYAHSRGVKMGLGLDINIIMPDYVGYSGTDSAVIAARVDQVATDYPDLDYLFCFKSENLPMTGSAWQACFLGYYNGLHTRCPDMKVVASGWGLDPSWVAPLPADVIAAPIAPYSATWENATAFGTREFWACPWMERDFASSEYFYPYNINLSKTIQNYQSRTANTKGLYCLTWRITDAVDPKLSYIARAPWDNANVYTSSNSVYQEYAVKNYGPVAGQMVTSIIDQNEPFATHFGECEGTFPFDGVTSTTGSLFNIYWFKFYSGDPTSVSPIYASNYSSMYNVTKYSASEGGLCLGSISQGSWFKFDAISFSPSMNSFQTRIASNWAGGGRLEIRLDSLTGTIIGTCVIRETGEWQNWQNVSAPISSVSGTHAVYFKVLRPDDRDLASQQMALIDSASAQTDDKVQQARLELLKCRIAAAKAYIDLDLGGASTANLQNFVDLMGQLVSNFTHRVVDISSLGNVASLQNRFVQLNYINVVKALRNTQAVKMPSNVSARGTANGAVISWHNEEPLAKGFNVYGNDVMLTSTPLDANCTTYYDTRNGSCNYSVTALNTSDVESIRSPAETCIAGTADTAGPYIALVSPPTSVARPDGADIKVRLLDNRSTDLLSATCYFRPLGVGPWNSVPMTRRINAVFAVRIADSDIPDEGFEYFITASDGTNESSFPADAPTRTMTSVVYGLAPQTLPSMPGDAAFTNGVLLWQAVAGDVSSYNIYRSTTPDFEPSPASFLTYVGSATTSFIDNKLDYDGSLIKDVKYYRITAVDISGHEGLPTAAIMAPPPDFTPTIRSLWNCDETSGTTCHDIFGSFDGVIQNASHNAEGKYDYCLDFNGTNSSVYISDSSQFQAYTIGAWVKVQNVRASSIIVRSSPVGPGSEYSHQLRINSAGKFQHYCFDGSFCTATGTTTIQPNQWYYVVISAQDRSSIKLYVNGELEATQVIDGNLWRGGDRWYFGIATAAIAYFDGLLDEVILFDTQLSDIEVNSLSRPGDFNGDQHVDFDDFAILANCWNTSYGDDDYNEKCNIARPVEQVIDFYDLAIFIDSWLN